ncbi:universal stress protein [Meiothermus rufus]|uniref:universal stress protein n=1 Tax=Meiothermus rufus TaxID=604332 RepID=UPI0004174363|nr:universal stress protein [Meiothermus rufus]
MYQRILLPIDGSTPSEQAAAVGLALARRLGARVVLVHVVEPQRYRELGNYTEALEQARTVGQALLEQWAHRAKRQKVAWATQRTSTQPESRPGVAEALIDAGVAHGCDLVVMGTHGRTGLPRLLLGSVAERMARLAPTPLLLVRPGREKPTLFKRILLAYDGSAYSERALQHADALAEALGAQLWIVHVVPDLAQLYLSAGRAWRFDPQQLEAQLAQEQQRLREQGAFILQEALKQCRQRKKAQTLLREASRHLIGERIREAAEEVKAELIVMGTHGHTGLRKFLLGSVAEDVVQQAMRPVLLVRNPATLAHPDETHLPPPGER